MFFPFNNAHSGRCSERTHCSQKRKSIALLWEQASSSWNTGGEYRLRVLAKSLFEGGFSPCFIAPGRRFSRSNALNIILTNLWFVIHTILLPKDTNIIILDYTLRDKALLFLIFWKLVRSGKIILTFNAAYFSYRTSKFKNTLDKILSYIVFHLADKVFTSGKALNAVLEKCGIRSERVRTFYPALRNGFRVQKGYPRQSSRGEVTRLVSVSRLHPIKGIEHLVQAMSYLKDESILLTIIGDTQSVPSYTDKILGLLNYHRLNAKITLVGRMSDRDIIQCFRESDIFVLPSLWETSPIVIPEAMVFGLPIIATDVGGIPEWVTHGKNGYLVPPKRSDVLADAVLRLHKAPELLAEMSQHSLAMSREFLGYTWSDVGHAYLKAIKSLL